MSDIVRDDAHEGVKFFVYNVEVGVTSELFNPERDQTAGCPFNATPEDSTNFDDNGTEFPGT